MSKTWPGGLIRKTPVIPAGPLQSGAAPGVWTMTEVNYWIKQGLWPTAGNFLAVEDVFSTWLYTGNGSTQTITNGIDLAGKGGLVWTKFRSTTGSHALVDTERGSNKTLFSNLTNAQSTGSDSVTAFNSNGFTNGTYNNASGETSVSWTFRKAPKFFDVVTWTGNGAASRNIPHNLGVAPGCIIVKDTSVADSWYVFHRSMSATPQSSAMTLNSTGAAFSSSGPWADTSPTSTQFTVGATSNTNGDTYVAYLFAHDATSDGIIQCGSYTIDGSGNGNPVTLGWEPQWLMVKNASGAGAWITVDQMRNFNNSTNELLYPNLTNAGASVNAAGYYIPNATGFTTGTGWTAGQTWIYIAIRRGPMRTPTSGTSVFAPILQQTGTLTTGFPIDTQFARWTGGPYANNTTVNDRLRAFSSTTTANTTGALITSSTSAETIAINTLNWTNTTAGVPVQLDGTTGIYWNFRRAPSFFDVVCYTGTGSARTVNHNLGVAPELMIVKIRNGSLYAWLVYSSTSLSGNTVQLNKSDAAFPDNGVFWTTTAPTSTVFSLNDNALNNEAGKNFVSYLFASAPGVSKVGSYTGNGSSQTINCGFTTGARFFLVKRTDSTGDWWVWDSARGITAPADPALTLNSTAAEVTSADATDPTNSGIIVNQEGTCNINVNGGTYIFLAVA